jgi:ADP-heptose:LPS heptosyltransferase
MGKALVYQALFETYRRLFGTKGISGPFSLAHDLDNIRKIVLVPEGGLESLIITRSFLRGLRTRYPSAMIAVVTPGEFSSVFEGTYWADRLFFYDDRAMHPFSRPLRDLIDQLRGESFDAAVDLSCRHSLETYLPVSLSGAAITVGFYDPSNVFDYSISVRAGNGGRPWLPRLWSLFEILDVHPEGDIYALPGREASVETVWKTIGFSIQPKQDQLLGVFLDERSSGVACRQEELSDLLKTLNTLPSKKILLAQNRISRAVWEDLPRYDVLILPRETIAKIAAILRECHCVLTNNVGFALLMASIGGRVVAMVTEGEIERLSLARIPGIEPFRMKGKGIPVRELGEFLRSVMRSAPAD